MALLHKPSIGGLFSNVILKWVNLPPKIYRTTNWPSYNRALVNRGNISIWFDAKTQWYAQSQGKQSRNRIYSDTEIQCCLIIKSLFRLLRIVTGFAQSLIRLCRLDWTAPDYTALCRTQKHIAISYQKSSDGRPCAIYCSLWLSWLEVSRWRWINARNTDLNIVANGVSSILL